MTDNLQALWDSLKAENTSSSLDPERIERIDTVMMSAFVLLKAFQRERDHQPFTSQASCPICGTENVIYSYHAPLVGSMRCDTPECIALSL